MEIILRKGLYVPTFGYLPPETRISLPADSDALGARLVERGYASEAAPEPPGCVYAVEDASEWISTSMRHSHGYDTPADDTADEAADDDE